MIHINDVIITHVYVNDFLFIMLPQNRTYARIKERAFIIHIIMLLTEYTYVTFHNKTQLKLYVIHYVLAQVSLFDFIITDTIAFIVSNNYLVSLCEFRIHNSSAHSYYFCRAISSDSCSTFVIQNMVRANKQLVELETWSGACRQLCVL